MLINFKYFCGNVIKVRKPSENNKIFKVLSPPRFGKILLVLNFSKFEEIRSDIDYCRRNEEEEEEENGKEEREEKEEQEEGGTQYQNHKFLKIPFTEQREACIQKI